VSDARIAVEHARYLLIARARTPRAVIFTVLFPIFFLVIFNSVFVGSGEEIKLSGGLRVAAESYFTGGIIAYSMALSTFSTLAVVLTSQRESGQLKRMRGTPMPPWTFVVGQILAAVAQVAAVTVVLLVIASLAYGVELPASTALGFAIYVVLGASIFCALGIALTVFTPTDDTAGAVAPFTVVMLSFVSGVFIPIETLPGWLEQIGRIFPLFHLADGLQTTLAPGASGIGLGAGNVAVLAVWGAGAIWIAARRFRWEPQASRG
jgi:ABC-2 type transport system permease protein